MKFYVDSCIYLNLWQKEGDETKGKPYWKIAKEFFEKYNYSIIYYSGLILKELEFSLTKKEYKNKKYKFNSSNFIYIIVTKELLKKARKIESELNFEISFYDILHMIIAQKTNSILITRDKKLIESAKKYNIKVKKPEDLS